MTERDGSIKYTPRPVPGEVPWMPAADILNDTRTDLHDLGLIGVYSNGVGYGNISLRLPHSSGFLITGTGTGDRRSLSRRAYCLVTDWRADSNEVWYCGAIRPSSESMSHGAVYAAHENITCVIHVHSRELFDRMLGEGYPKTPANAAFGTPEIATAIQRLVSQQPSPDGIFVTAGHPEGIIACGPDIQGALSNLLSVRG